jgi:hypothetical protein
MSERELIWMTGRPAHRPFRGMLGVNSRYGLHTRAVTVYRDTLTRGFSHFVTSMTAPVASDWSGCRVGLAPTGKRRLFTAHTQRRHQAAWTCAENYLRSGWSIGGGTINEAARVHHACRRCGGVAGGGARGNLRCLGVDDCVEKRMAGG